MPMRPLPGQLTDPTKSKGGWAFCKTCACAWQTTLVNATRYASTIPSALHRPVTPAQTK
jgi:hypothetical protein